MDVDLTSCLVRFDYFSIVCLQSNILEGTAFLGNSSRIYAIGSSLHLVDRTKILFKMILYRLLKSSMDGLDAYICLFTFFNNLWTT
jgi:hypothetical protein